MPPDHLITTDFSHKVISEFRVEEGGVGGNITPLYGRRDTDGNNRKK